MPERDDELLFTVVNVSPRWGDSAALRRLGFSRGEAVSERGTSR